jgi:hypothetical protein
MSLVRLAIFAFTAAFAASTAHAQIAFRASSQGIGATTTITHVAAGGAGTSNGCPSSITPPVPGGLAGDLLIALVVSKDSATLTPSAGWNTLFAQNPVATYRARIYWRIATGADALTVSKAGAGCNVMYGRMGRFRGVDALDPIFNVTPATQIPAANWSYQNSATVNSGTRPPTPNAMLLFAV